MAPEVLGRETELAQIARALDRAVVDPTYLRIIGEPGIGKTTLLAAARAAAADRGFSVLGCAPVSVESEMSYAGLTDLLSPLTDRLPELPEPQQLALEAALLRRVADGPSAGRPHRRRRDPDAAHPRLSARSRAPDRRRSAVARRAVPARPVLRRTALPCAPRAGRHGPGGRGTCPARLPRRGPRRSRPAPRRSRSGVAARAPQSCRSRPGPPGDAADARDVGRQPALRRGARPRGARGSGTAQAFRPRLGAAPALSRAPGRRTPGPPRGERGRGPDDVHPATRRHRPPRHRAHRGRGSGHRRLDRRPSGVRAPHVARDRLPLGLRSRATRRSRAPGRRDSRSRGAGLAPRDEHAGARGRHAGSPRGRRHERPVAGSPVAGGRAAGAGPGPRSRCSRAGPPGGSRPLRRGCEPAVPRAGRPRAERRRLEVGARGRAEPPGGDHLPDRRLPPSHRLPGAGLPRSRGRAARSVRRRRRPRLRLREPGDEREGTRVDHARRARRCDGRG